MKKLKMAIIGQGRSGRDIHGKFLKTEANVFFDVVAVVEQDPERRERALAEYPGCKVYEKYQDLFELEGIDLVLNDTYSDQHYSISKDLLMHGFNVLVEKPMARNYFECADLIATAKARNLVMAVFQQTFLAPFYLETKKIIESGKIGDVKQISIHYNGFGRRWDWQTLQCRMAGSLYNTGPHPVGLALDLLDFDKNVRVAFSKLDQVLTSGDAEDYVKIILTAPDKPVVDLEINSTDAFNDYNLKFQGTRGTYQCTTSEYKMKYIVDGENPEKPVIKESLKDEEGLPIYCGEKLITHDETGTFEGSAFDSAVKSFYTMLYDTLTTGAPLAVKPEWAAQFINVMEIVHGQNPMPVIYTAE